MGDVVQATGWLGGAREQVNGTVLRTGRRQNLGFNFGKTSARSWYSWGTSVMSGGAGVDTLREGCADCRLCK